MNQLPLSVVIPVSSDRRLTQCLASIDEAVEVVIILNNHPAPEVVAIAAGDPHTKVVLVSESGCNLARVFNLGIDTATHDCVLLMNSDCVFPSGLIRRMAELLERTDIVKARVRFAYRTVRQKLVARCRSLFHEHFDGGRNLFGPGLAFNKRIRWRLGGYYFNEVMGWGEDGELSKRIHTAQLAFTVVDECIVHSPEGILHDLKVAMYIGRGRRRLHSSKNMSIWKTMATDLTDTLLDRRCRFRQALTIGGWLLCSYYGVWRVAMYLGYYTHFNRRTKPWS